MFQTLEETTYESKIAKVSAGILICFKQLCPHCRNMEKAIEKFAKRHAQVSLFKLDMEENPEASQALESQRAPTLFVIKAGKIVARKAGLMNPKELTAFYKNA